MRQQGPEEQEQGNAYVCASHPPTLQPTAHTRPPTPARPRSCRSAAGTLWCACP